jgi:hypothetical protein
MEVEQMMARLLEEMRTNQPKADANQEEMKAKRDSHHEKLMIMKAGKEKIQAVWEACLEITDFCLVSKEPTSEETKSKAEHEEVSKEEDAVGTFGPLKGRYRGRHLAVRCRGQPKKRTQGNGGSRKKLIAACRGMTRRATPARTLSSGTRPYQEPRKEGRSERDVGRTSRALLE